MLDDIAVTISESDDDTAFRFHLTIGGDVWPWHLAEAYLEDVVSHLVLIWPRLTTSCIERRGRLYPDSVAEGLQLVDPEADCCPYEDSLCSMDAYHDLSELKPGYGWPLARVYRDAIGKTMWVETDNKIYEVDYESFVTALRLLGDNAAGRLSPMDRDLAEAWAKLHSVES